jgi:hypothetical protein
LLLDEKHGALRVLLKNSLNDLDPNFFDPRTGLSDYVVMRIEAF